MWYLAGGTLIVIIAVGVLCGSVYLILGTNMGARLGFLVAFVSIAALTARSGGVFGPDVPVGWPNRIGILAGCAWLLIVAREARHLVGPR